MTMRLLWFVLAGFLLGFAASTLWEWLYFRRERMKLRDERVRELEVQLAEEQKLLAQLRVTQSPTPVWPQPEPQSEYHSPGVFLESEASGVPGYEPVPESRRSEGPPRIERTPASSSFVPDQVPEQSEPEEDIFEDEPDDDANSLERLAAELVQDPGETAPEVEPEIEYNYRPRKVQRSTDFPDDLSAIKGIGDVYKYRLYAAGIYTWHQIAESDIETLRAATNAYPGSNVEEWPEQARALAEKHGRRNAYYTGPTPDDLTKIIGIGPVGERTLYRAGICTYEQLAGTTVGELHELFPIAIAGDEPDFEGWIQHAIEFAQRKRKE